MSVSKESLSELSLLTDAEKHQILVEWNDTRSDYAQDECFHELFQSQAERTPDAVAIVFQDHSLTYRELNRRANQLAHYLSKLGVAPEVLVGICIERSLEMVVGLLGILKAGGAYVSLDPAYPQERLAFILQDAQASVLLTQQPLLARLPSPLLPIPYSLLLLDSDWPAIVQENETNPVRDVTSGNLAYVIYTSGSTGRPKGVAIQHHNTTALIHWAGKIFDAAALAGTLASTSICFDLSIFELFVPLSRGGAAIVAETALDLPALHAAQAVTLINTVPSAMRTLLRTDGVPTSTRVVNLAGEPLQTRLVQQIYQYETVRKVFDLYGPSEDTTYSTYALRSATGPDTIGRPIANTEIYLLDPQLRALPVGVPGELYIAGHGLARGYLNQPWLTAERFIPHPFSEQPGARLFKTGDLARYLPDGNIEFLGRTDHQVKLRGFRIELGEIEAVLAQHPAVQETVVLARESESGDKQLVAYVVVNQGESVAADELRRFLRAKLPDYMLPSVFVTLPALPLTPSGKIDRRALPAPDASRRDVPPRTATEKILAAIWAKVLGLKHVGVHDNFVELGGHSLLAVQAIFQVRDTLQVELSVNDFFHFPTVAALARIVEAARGGERGRRIPSIKPVSRHLPLPLSFQQQQLWFFAQLHPEHPVYNETFAIHMSGDVDAAVLEQCLTELIRRHEILRTTFVAIDGKPLQVIHPPAPFHLPLADFCELPRLERKAEALRWATQELRQPFDLARGPLFRAALMRLGETDYRLFLAMHHIILDGVSIYNVFFPELEALYVAFSAGRSPALPEPELQYADFAAWQRQWLSEEVLAEHLAYWEAKLAALPTLQLPTDHPRPTEATFRGARQCLALSSRLTEQLKALSRQQGVTLFVTLASAIVTLLHRYSAQEDVVIGTFTAGRDRPEIQGIMGDSLNTVVLRTDLSGNPTFRQLLQRVQNTSLEAYAHQDLPFDRLVAALQPERRASQNPLFQVVFVIEPALPASSLGWTLSQLDVHSGTSKMDLTIELDERQEGIIGRLEYSTALFKATTIKRLVGHLQTLLESIVAAGGSLDQRLTDLPFLTDVERRQILVSWNHTQADYPTERCIHQLFEQQVERTPDAVALVFMDQHLTYQELDRRANQLAHHLLALGVRPEVLVGICAERSLELVVGLYGVLKAGGAYLPLDPGYPQERLAFMLADAQAPVLLTQQHLLEHLPNSQLLLDTNWQTIAQQPAHNATSGVSDDDLAYVIYTSGSTGQPKGALNTHAGIRNRLLWMQEAYRLTATDRVLQKTPFSFDVSVWEFFWPLLNGACLVMAQPEGHKDSAYLVRIVVEQHVTTMHFVPAMLQVFLEHPQVQSCHSLRHVFCSGEALPSDLQERFFARLGAELHNLYGPTEAAVDVTFWPCERQSERSLVPIGRPIANTRIYLLDAQLQPVPVGVPGELHIGGIGLARGYLRRPELSAERFVPNPWSEEPGARLYKTGDLACYLPGGEIVFLGRLDHQVKVRGFRIELGEIEATLRQHPEVREAVVLAWNAELGPGGGTASTQDRRLVAYVAAQDGCQFAGDALRRFLREKLPDYMLPSAFVTLEALPLSPNGKIDRKALPAPDLARPETSKTFVAPRTPTEKTLTTIWTQVLGVDQVGVWDDFFELGGHSLLATRITSRVQSAFQVELPLRSFFDTPTVAHLAERIDVFRWATQDLSAPPDASQDDQEYEEGAL